ncbi:hypothetical protein E2C01_102591 [Portunus trituberculatus]|uniref:Uncharacterized protein n=1 Tax=Portunus trituberculatus TaxID=210409 RepID=A0A5B7KDP6_PORTR|nr:hypothetical protein [Portunus trituberculatus]
MYGVAFMLPRSARPCCGGVRAEVWGEAAATHWSAVSYITSPFPCVAATLHALVCYFGSVSRIFKERAGKREFFVVGDASPKTRGTQGKGNGGGGEDGET